jgi:hypothetical protein
MIRAVGLSNVILAQVASIQASRDTASLARAMGRRGSDGKVVLPKRSVRMSARFATTRHENDPLSSRVDRTTRRRKDGLPE